MTSKNFKVVALQLIADWNRDDINRHSKPSPTLEVLEARALALINILQSQKEKCPMWLATSTSYPSGTTYAPPRRKPISSLVAIPPAGRGAAPGSLDTSRGHVLSRSA